MHTRPDHSRGHVTSPSGFRMEREFSQMDASRREFPLREDAGSQHTAGSSLAVFVSAVTRPEQVDRRKIDTMARAPIPTRARKRPTSQRYDEQRPVLQLPLESPAWRDPVREPEPSEPSEPSERREGERGIAVIDFYI